MLCMQPSSHLKHQHQLPALGEQYSGRLHVSWGNLKRKDCPETLYYQKCWAPVSSVYSPSHLVLQVLPAKVPGKRLEYTTLMQALDSAASEEIQARLGTMASLNEMHVAKALSEMLPPGATGGCTPSSLLQRKDMLAHVHIICPAVLMLQILRVVRRVHRVTMHSQKRNQWPSEMTMSCNRIARVPCDCIE